MDDENQELIPKKQTLFPLSAEDIVDNALQNLDESQARRVTEKAADEIVRLAVEKRKAEYRNSAAQDEMRNLINNANLLDQRVGDYKITSTFETASGTTNVEIRKSKLTPTNVAVVAIALVLVIAIAVLLLFRSIKIKTRRYFVYVDHALAPIKCAIAPSSSSHLSNSNNACISRHV